jgi:hypothetical protein
VRTLCFILGVLSIAACVALVVLGIITDTDGSATAQTLRGAPPVKPAAGSAVLDLTRPEFFAVAQIFGLVGIAWMVGAAAFASKRSALEDDLAAQPAQQWAAQFSPQQRPYPGDNPQYPGGGPEAPTTRL